MTTTPSQQTQPTLSERSLGGLLDETFSIYFRHFWRFAKLAAPIQLPVGIISILLLQLFEGPPLLEAAAFVLAVFVGVFGAIFLFGAVATAVGQQYVTGKIALRSCYLRAWWKVVSLAVIAFVSLAVIAFVAALFMFVASMAMSVTDGTWLVGAAALVLIPAFALLISLSVEAVIVEGHKAVGAFRRSSALIKGSWWRVFGIMLVLLLISIGLSIVATIPFALVSIVVNAQPASNAAASIVSVGEVVVRIVVFPVLFIAATLVYYDVRIRKEQYDLPTLSSEMGIAAS